MNLFSASRRPIKLLSNRYAGHPFRVLSATLKGFFLFHLLWDHLYTINPTEGPSMLPTFEVRGDTIIVDRWYRRGRGIQVGDVVAFDSVVHPGEKVLKRVIGMEGDYVLRDMPESGNDVMIQVSYNHFDLCHIRLIKLRFLRVTVGSWETIWAPRGIHFSLDQFLWHSSRARLYIKSCHSGNVE